MVSGRTQVLTPELGDAARVVTVSDGKTVAGRLPGFPGVAPSNRFGSNVGWVRLATLTTITWATSLLASRR